MTELSIFNFLSFFLIFFVGLPHGSFDGAVASLIGFKSKLQFAKFILYYLILVVFVIIFWVNFPVIALLIFLFMTIVHFGLCDWSNFNILKHKFSITLTYGMIVIFGIIFFNENQSFEIFTYLSGNEINYFKRYLYIPYSITTILLIYFMYLSYFEKKLRKGIIEILSLISVFYFFDALLSFAIYFCFIHTYKHLKHLITNVYLHLPNKKFVIYSTLIFTIVSWIGGFIIILFLSQNFTFYESILKVIFIGLASLTLPHMLLVDLIYRKRYK